MLRKISVVMTLLLRVELRTLSRVCVACRKYEHGEASISGGSCFDFMKI